MRTEIIKPKKKFKNFKDNSRICWWVFIRREIYRSLNTAKKRFVLLSWSRKNWKECKWDIGEQTEVGGELGRMKECFAFLWFPKCELQSQQSLTARVHKAWNCRQSSPHHTISFNIKKSNPHSKQVSDNFKRVLSREVMSRRLGLKRNEEWKHELAMGGKTASGAEGSRKLSGQSQVCSTNCGHGGDMTSCIGLIPTAWPADPSGSAVKWSFSPGSRALMWLPPKFWFSSCCPRKGQVKSRWA